MVAGLGWLVLGSMVGLPPASLVGVLVAGSSLGFLGHNWPPARIFMGDVGSAFFGFTLAVLAVVGGLADPRLPLAGVLVVWPFVFDTTFTILRRLRCGENIFAAHSLPSLPAPGDCGLAPSRRDAARSGPGRARRCAGRAVDGAAPGSDFAVAVLSPVCALLLWRGVLRVEVKASPRG